MSPAVPSIDRHSPLYWFSDLLLLVSRKPPNRRINPLQTYTQTRLVFQAQHNSENCAFPAYDSLENLLNAPCFVDLLGVVSLTKSSVQKQIVTYLSEIRALFSVTTLYQKLSAHFAMRQIKVEIRTFSIITKIVRLNGCSFHEALVKCFGRVYELETSKNVFTVVLAYSASSG